MTTFQFAEEFSFSEARSHLADIANEVIYAGKRAILTRKGKQVVAIVSMDDLEALNAIEDQIDLDDVKKALADVKKRGTISLDAIKRKHNL
jgi:prevent-host-death family protein